MAIARYFAMTAAEILKNPAPVSEIAWMACHFSPYSDGLSNFPDTLPTNSVLILNDRTPIHGHDPERIAWQLKERLEGLGCRGLLLDFERPGEKETAALAALLTESLPCPVVVSSLYGENLDCPVFLPPAPLSTPLEDYLAPWRGREVWLEMALDGETISLTEKGAEAEPLPFPELMEEGLRENALHCHYHICVSSTEARFTLWRTRDDLEALLEEAEALGVTTTVGLYQEFRETLGVRSEE